MNTVSALTKEAPGSSLIPLTMGMQCVDRQLSMNEDTGPHQTPNLQHLGPGLLSFRNFEKQTSVVSKAASIWYFVTAAQTG